MFVRRKKNRSGTITVAVVEKRGGKHHYLHTLGTSSDETHIARLEKQAHNWIANYLNKREPKLDFEKASYNKEKEQLDKLISCIDKALINGVQLILNNVFDSIGFNAIEDNIFRQLVLARLAFPSSKLATAEYLKTHFDEDVELHKIYRYLDKLNNTHKQQIQDISVKHTMQLFGGTLGALFYDVTTLYFETDKDDDLRKTGFSKEGRHSNPQIILGLLVSVDGYPLAYTIHEGNKYEGHTMLPVISEFITKYQLDDFIVVADSGLLTSANIEQMEELGYKYIVGARIKNMSTSVKKWILSLPKADKQIIETNYEGERRLLVGYTDKRARKDKYNRDKGIRRLEKSYRNGQFTKSSLNKKGYNKFLVMQDSVSVSIDYEKIAEEALWDGFKGYITNTKIPTGEVYSAYHNLWHVERSFRISKSKIEMRPMFHFTRRRIEAHICICFVALKVYKELERVAKLQGIELSVDKILDAAKTIITLKCTLPNSCTTEYRTLITTDRQKEIESLLDRKIWVSQTNIDYQ